MAAEARRRGRRSRWLCSTPRSGSIPTGNWLRQALPVVAQRLRDAVERFAGEPTAAGAYAGDVEGWLQLTGYVGAAAAKARALRCRAVDTLTEAGETLGATQVLVAVQPPDLARLGRLREDLEWELEAVTRRRPTVQRKRLTAGERERPVQLLETVERLPSSGRIAAAATTLPLVTLPALGPGLPPRRGRRHAPVPDKARTGRFFGRRVTESRTGLSPPTPGGG